MINIRYFLTHLTLRHGRRRSRKKGELLGERFLIQRERKRRVEVFLYRPDTAVSEKRPVLFNIHGGAWVAGDATGEDSLCRHLCDALGAFVVNINYTKADDRPFPYMQYEVFDTVRWFWDHAEEYGLDKERCSVIGYSAGANLAAGTAFLIKDAGISLNSLILGYPFLDFREVEELVAGKVNKRTVDVMRDIFFNRGADLSDVLFSPLAADNEKLVGYPPTLIIGCEKDGFGLYPHAVAYRDKLDKAGVRAELISYSEAVHGFLEYYWPEFRGTFSEEQKQYRDDAFERIISWLREEWKQTGNVSEYT